MSKSFYKEIEEEFDKRFTVSVPYKSWRKAGSLETVIRYDRKWPEKQPSIKYIKSFLKKSLIKAIEEVKLEGFNRFKATDECEERGVEYFNQAIDELESLKKKLIKDIQQ